MGEPPHGDRDQRVADVAGNLRVDAVTAEVVPALAAAGIPSILLKGPAVGRWLYPAPEVRPYRDCDVLVDPALADAAGAVLEGLGFTPRFDRRGLPAWWDDHAHEWWREGENVVVDVHARLPGIAAEPAVAWDVLAARTVPLEVAGRPVRVLDLPARVLHVALHAAQHGPAHAKPHDDLARAVQQVPEAVWGEVAALARQLDATSALAAALRTGVQAAALADRLGLPTDVPADVALRAGSPPPAALGFEQLAQARGVRARLSVLRHKVVPPPGFMRRWHPLASRGRAGLLAAYVVRPVWLLRAAPRGFRAWRAARRASGR